MAIRGSVTLECDSPRCHAELVLGDLDLEVAPQKQGGLELTAYAPDWREDEDGLLHCPQCCEEGREKGDDDGQEYADPRDAREERL
jgi:hypothetical protein